MQPEPGNSRTVFVVQADYTKDLSDAKRYGNLCAVFAHVRKPYDTQSMVRKARSVLRAYRDGDYLLMIGDPALCAVCMSVVSQRESSINVLSWDRNSFSYAPQRWPIDEFADFEEFPTADDTHLQP